MEDEKIVFTPLYCNCCNNMICHEINEKKIFIFPSPPHPSKK